MALMLIAAVTATASDAPMEEVVVTGEYAGPGMWQVTHTDHPGHTLWIVGEPHLLPQNMRWRSQKVERVASQSQEILVQPGLGLKPDKKVGVFRMLTLVPAALRLRKNPGKAKLKELLPPKALTKNESTLAFVKMSDLLGEQGYLESLRQRGYEILAPG
jgi:hypothetical protein